MTQVRAVAFSFTRPDSIVIVAKKWVDPDGKRYRVHVYPNPNKQELDLEEERPNVVMVTQPDKVRSLNPIAESIYRVILFGPPDEIIPLDVPMMDAVKDDQGKFVSAPRTSRKYLNQRVEEEAVLLDLTPIQKAKAPQKKRGRKKIPTSLAVFLDTIEEGMDDGDIWEDLERPVLDYALGRTTEKEFQTTCKRLIRLGVQKKLARAYFRWVAVNDEGAALIAAFETVATNLDDGVTIDIQAISEKHEVKPDDLSVLYNMYKGELEEGENE